MGGTNFSAVGGTNFKEKGSSQFSGNGLREKRGPKTSECIEQKRPGKFVQNSCVFRVLFRGIFRARFLGNFAAHRNRALCCCLWSRRGRAALRAGDLLCFRCALYVLPLALLPWRQVVLRVAPSRAFRPFPMCSHVCSRLGGEWPPPECPPMKRVLEVTKVLPEDVDHATVEVVARRLMCKI